MTDLSIYLHIISSDACGDVRTMAFPFIKNGMANPLDILVLRKERQNKLFENGSGEPSPPIPTIKIWR
jgi:hypothetical protein